MAILGEPNVGKSSLFNLLSRKDAAIVTSTPGTTRDVIELTTNICGYPMVLADTAGIRSDPENEIEVEGIRRAKECTKRADLVMCVISAEKYFQSSCKNLLGIRAEKIIVVVNKVDLLVEEERKAWKGENVVAFSCKTQEGLEELTDTLAKYFKEMYVKNYRIIENFCSIIPFKFTHRRCGNPSEENPVISHARYRNHLSRVTEYLRAYLKKTEIRNYDMAISLQDIRGAARELGKITGSINNEDILDVIFKNFCVGK